MISEEQLSIGKIKKEGGCMNYCRPLLFDSGRKAAVICGQEIKILNVSDGIQDHIFYHQRRRVVGLALSNGEFHSCDEKGQICIWQITEKGITVSKKIHLPLPNKSTVEQLANISENGRVSIVARFASGEQQLLSKSLETNAKDYDVLINNIVSGSNSFSFSKHREFCVGLMYQGTYSAFEVVPTKRPNQKNKSLLMEHQRKKRILAQNRTFTCVTAHPTEFTVAAGDNYGGVEVYYNVFDKRYRTSRRLGLHRLATSDLLFSINGSELYSCSQQGVLVLWALRQGNAKQKQHLPQLDSPMTHLSMDNAGAVLLATHTDNSFSVVDVVEFKLVNVFVGLGVPVSVREQVSRFFEQRATPATAEAALPHTAGDRSKFDSVILAYDPRTKGVVTKSRPGHLHFYSTDTEQQLFLVDVVHENFRMDAATYRDVTHVSFSRDGCVMVTVDAMEGDPLSQQLKFWLFDHQNQRWRMDTSVLCPHSALIRGCELQPQGDTSASDLPLCLTYCTEGVLKLWKGCLDQGVSQWASAWESQCWDGHKPATCGRWSWCGQVLAVAHLQSVSVWRPQPLQWNFQLSHARLQEPVIDMCFSSATKGSAVTCLVECRSTGVTSWCLRSRRLLYTALLPAVAMAYDPDAAVVAVSTATGEIMLFRGDEGEPLKTCHIGPTEAFKLLFLPLPALPPRLLSTRLFFFSSSTMELCSIPVHMCGSTSLSSTVGATKLNNKNAKKESQFSSMLAHSKTVEAPVESIFSFRVSDKSSVLPSTFITEDFEDTCDLMSQLSKLVLDFDKKAASLSAR
ncbi:WD40-repeat-containing domain [Trinorchestia longiramus]|nr:WD40-repeat-containing domain [Trinorchestia longiramus]